jgi:hypothetical protein
MKKAILFFVSLIFVSVIFAQKGTIEFSVNSGFNYSHGKLVNQEIDYVYNGSWKLSRRYGIGIKKEVFKNFHLGMELNMEEKGWLQKNVTVVETTFGFLAEGHGNFYYPILGIPILLDYGFKYKRLSGFVEGGFVTSIKRPGGAIKTGYDNTCVASIVQPDYAALLTFGFSYGAGLKYNVYKNWNISIIGRSAGDVTGIATWGVMNYMRHKNYTGLVTLSYSLKKASKK